MIITLRNGKSIDTDRDLVAAERHVLQKLLLWETMAASLGEFQERRKQALLRGWNNSGPLEESPTLRLILQDLENKVRARLAGS